uniref:Uncharacterized protein n=1 Tax=Xenopus tropicalis TaxID=8364 RepID=A0A1B8Y2N0_XENTR
MFTAVHMEPFSTSAFKFSFEYLLLPPRSAPAAAPPGPSPGASAPTAAASYSSRPSPRGLTQCRRRPGMGPTLQRHPFSGLVIRQVSCTHSLADSDFHGHRPAVYINQHLFWGLMSVGIGRLTRRSVHPAAPVLLTKSGH